MTSVLHDMFRVSETDLAISPGDMTQMRVEYVLEHLYVSVSGCKRERSIAFVVEKLKAVLALGAGNQPINNLF